MSAKKKNADPVVAKLELKKSDAEKLLGLLRAVLPALDWKGAKAAVEIASLVEGAVSNGVSD